MARVEGEHIYRRVSVRINADEKVRRLSRPQPCGLSLFHELIFGEQTGIIPGLFRIGEAGLAEQLGWPLDGEASFRTAWAEIEREELAVADWGARLVWVPKALRHNIPASPNVIIGWRIAWDLLPECELKAKAKASIKAFLKAYSEPYAKAFEKATAKALPKLTGEPSAKASPNQEAVSSKQLSRSGSSSRDGVRGREFTGVDNSPEFPQSDRLRVDGLPAGALALSETDDLQIRKLFAEGKNAEAQALLASLPEARKRSIALAISQEPQKRQEQEP